MYATIFAMLKSISVKSVRAVVKRSPKNAATLLGLRLS